MRCHQCGSSCWTSSVVPRGSTSFVSLQSLALCVAGGSGWRSRCLRSCGYSRARFFGRPHPGSSSIQDPLLHSQAERSLRLLQTQPIARPAARRRAGGSPRARLSQTSLMPTPQMRVFKSSISGSWLPSSWVAFGAAAVVATAGAALPARGEAPANKVCFTDGRALRSTAMTDLCNNPGRPIPTASHPIGSTSRGDTVPVRGLPFLLQGEGAA